MQESGEMYLETILILNRENKNIRAIDICSSLGYSKPSVSRALSILKVEGYVQVDSNGYITLTESGRDVAEKIYERHVILSDLFMSIGVSKETAHQDACRIEHVISDESFEKIRDHLKSMK